MENILQLSKIPEGTANPCSCGCNDLTYLLYQTDQGDLWAVGCNNCGFEMKPEGKTKEEALSLWDAKMKPKPSRKAQTRAQNKYIKKRYDRINLTVEKGEKDILKAHADIYDEGSVNAFINRAIKETMARDKCQPKINVDNQKVVKECAKYIDDEMKKKYFFGEKPKSQYLGFSQHDCCSYHKCPVCNSTFDTWIIFNQEKNENGSKDYCPNCKTELEIR